MASAWDARVSDGVAAVERLGQDACDGGLADAAVAGKDVAVGDALLVEGVGQGAGYVVLAGNVEKALRPVFSSQNLITHRCDCSLADCNGWAMVEADGGGWKSRVLEVAYGNTAPMRAGDGAVIEPAPFAISG